MTRFIIGSFYFSRYIYRSSSLVRTQSRSSAHRSMLTPWLKLQKITGANGYSIIDGGYEDLINSYELLVV